MVRISRAHHSCSIFIVPFYRELAELLGQVKPPVASREDIDNSGLQIIKATEMKRYEDEGKVASNCTDRVRVSCLQWRSFFVAELLPCSVLSAWMIINKKMMSV